MRKYVFICLLNFLYLGFLFYPYEHYGVETALPYDIENNNVSLLFTLTNEGGRIENLNYMKSIFEDKSLGFVYESFHNKSANFIYDKITETCKDLDEEATLLLYLNGHGGGYNKNFAMDASDQKLKFSKILNSIIKVKPIKRLVVFVDTCHAEGAINEGFQGGGRILKSKPKLAELTDKINFPAMFKENEKIYFGEDTKAYEELLIIVSSSADKLTTRGIFARNMKKTFENIKKDKNASVYDFLNLFAQLDIQSGQQPYYKIIPESILNEPLFKNTLARSIPIKDKEKFKKSYILLPEFKN
jgi:hypothetical protein